MMSDVPAVRHRGAGLYAAVVVLWCMLAPCGASAEQFTGKVVAIADGDTIQVLRAGKAVKVRLYGVDAPEKAQSFGTQARKFTGDLVFQQTVTVAIRDTDRYGRLVGEVRLPDGRSLGHELVRAGLAWEYRQPSRAHSAVVPVSPRSAPAPQCCKTCRSGQACGDTCIPQGQTCTRP